MYIGYCENSTRKKISYSAVVVDDKVPNKGLYYFIALLFFIFKGNRSVILRYKMESRGVLFIGLRGHNQTLGTKQDFFFK